LNLGVGMHFDISYGRTATFAPRAKSVCIDIDPVSIGLLPSRGLVGDARRSSRAC
jgi:hypothetical protein